MKKTIFTSLLSATFILQGFLGVSAASAQVATSYAYPSYCPQLSYNLYIGLSDYYTQGQVSQLQQYLSTQGYYQPITGYFGSVTRSNVAQFQQAHAIYPVTGGVGPLTRAAIAQLCGGQVSSQGTFYLNQPFTITVNQTLQQYGGGINFTLNAVSEPLYTATPYPGYGGYGESATVTLSLGYSTQQFTLTQGQSVTWQNYTVTLGSLSYNSATVTVSGYGQGGTTQGSLSANPTSGQAPLSVSFSGSVTNSGQYIIDYGDGQTSGPVQASCYNYYGSSYNCSISTSHVYSSAGTYTAVLSNYVACEYSNPRCMIATAPLSQTTVTVSGGQIVGGLTVTSPTAGQVYSRGSQVQIAWGYPVTPGSVSTVLDLYTAAGGKIGTIAVINQTSGTYTWNIPPYPNTLMCTMQYPNGLCGQYIPSGQYYIEASATNGNGLSSFTPIATGQSGIFTIQ